MKRFNWLKAGVVIFTLATISFASRCADTRREYHYFDDMHYSPGGDTAKFDALGHRQYDMSEPENTVPYLGSPKYPYKKDVDADIAATTLQAPASLDIKRGAHKFAIYCSPCHGALGYADGPVAKKFAGVRPLVTAPGKTTERAESYAMAKIYHIATVGQGAMQGYAPQVQSQDRWNIAAYVKYELQKKK